jgi:hypothetical protein
MQNPDDIVSCRDVIEDPALDLFEGNGRALYFEEEFFRNPSDIGDSPNSRKRIFHPHICLSDELKQF